METPKTAEFAHIGKSVIIKGELSGSEDLYVDGQVEGSIELSGNRLIIGPHGQVRANVNAKGVIVQGKLDIQRETAKADGAKTDGAKSASTASASAAAGAVSGGAGSAVAGKANVNEGK